MFREFMAFYTACYKVFPHSQAFAYKHLWLLDMDIVLVMDMQSLCAGSFYQAPLCSVIFPKHAGTLNHNFTFGL